MPTMQCLPLFLAVVRLVNGARDSEGRIEVYMEDAWYSLCDDLFHEVRDAEVVCISLGYRYSIISLNDHSFHLRNII